MQICQLQAFRGLGLHRSSRKWPVKATIQTKYTYKSGFLLSLRVRTLSPISGLDAFQGVRVLGEERSYSEGIFLKLAIPIVMEAKGCYRLEFL